MISEIPENKTRDRAVETPRHRILVLGSDQSILPVLPARAEVTLIREAQLAFDVIQLGSAANNPFSLVVIPVQFAPIPVLSEFLRQLQQRDSTLHAIVYVQPDETDLYDALASIDLPDRCLIVNSDGQPCSLSRLVSLVLDKSQAEREANKLQEELINLNGRRSLEIATAHADLINLNHKLESARDAAESASRAKSAFLATMSHEIRTPMTAMLGFADYLLDEGDIRQAPRERIEAINTIVRNGHHLVQLINDILDLSKIEANRVDIERIPCRPMTVIADVMSLMRGRAEEKKLALQVATEGLIPESIQSDPTRIRQILVNVVGNAIKFTEQGHVRIVMRYAADSDTPQLQFEVSDTGIGMTPQQLGKLFQPFSQADMSMTRRYGGTGLGLCISQRFAELLGGRIDVQSQPGNGTTFLISISVGDASSLRLVSYDSTRDSSEEDPYAIAEARRVQVQISGRILIAEDGPDNQRLFAHLLRKAGATVTLVDNGELACLEVAAAESRGEPYDVVLMDMQMPVLDGYAAAGRLRSSGCELPILALTAFAMTGDRDKCIQAGCTDYLTKPIDRKVFLPMVAKYVAQSRNRQIQSDTTAAS